MLTVSLPMFHSILSPNTVHSSSSLKGQFLHIFFFFYNSTKSQIKLVFCYYYLVEQYYCYILYNCILYSYYYYSIQLGFPGGSDGKVSACNVGDLDSVPGLGRSPGEGNGNPFQYS